MNFTAVRGPYGGANSFLRALRGALEDHGLKVVTTSADRADVALLNALTQDLDREAVERIAERGVPIVHRKTGYRGRGSEELRAEVDGIVVGDRLQIEFGPFVAHTIFQSAYSRDVFTASGFEGDFTVIPNGVDARVFNTDVRKGLFRRVERRSWDGGEPLRVAISTWSTDPSKGFPEYARIDDELGEIVGVEVRLIGRVPSGLTLSSIATTPPKSRFGLARFLKEQHVLLHLTQWESCSNALLEGINCGLPVIYLDSGSNREFAERYGVEYRGNFREALDEVKAKYAELQPGTRGNPYGISRIAPEYVRVLESVA